MFKIPNRLCLKDGVLHMQDGSDVTKYLKSRPIKDANAVVLFTREEAQRLISDSYAYQISKLNDDERFTIAA